VTGYTVTGLGSSTELVVDVGLVESSLMTESTISDYVKLDNATGANRLRVTVQAAICGIGVTVTVCIRISNC
jgi:hypothetical protein